MLLLRAACWRRASLVARYMLCYVSVAQQASAGTIAASVEVPKSGNMKVGVGLRVECSSDLKNVRQNCEFIYPRESDRKGLSVEATRNGEGEDEGKGEGKGKGGCQSTSRCIKERVVNATSKSPKGM
jgi:hypothetical protein